MSAEAVAAELIQEEEDELLSMDDEKAWKNFVEGKSERLTTTSPEPEPTPSPPTLTIEKLKKDLAEKTAEFVSFVYVTSLN